MASRATFFSFVFNFLASPSFDVKSSFTRDSPAGHLPPHRSGAARPGFPRLQPAAYLFDTDFEANQSCPQRRIQEAQDQDLEPGERRKEIGRPVEQVINAVRKFRFDFDSVFGCRPACSPEILNAQEWDRFAVPAHMAVAHLERLWLNRIQIQRAF